MNYTEQFKENKSAVLKALEAFLNIDKNNADRLAVNYYRNAEALTKVLAITDALIFELSTHIESCDCEKGASSLPALESLLVRICEQRKLCERFLSECEKALADKNTFAYKLRALADKAIHGIVLL